MYYLSLYYTFLISYSLQMTCFKILYSYPLLWDFKSHEFVPIRRGAYIDIVFYFWLRVCSRKLFDRFSSLGLWVIYVIRYCECDVYERVDRITDWITYNIYCNTTSKLCGRPIDKKSLYLTQDVKYYNTVE